MGDLIDLGELTRELFLGVSSLCDVPYELAAISAASQHIGWQIIPPEDWEIDAENPFLRIYIRSDLPYLLALWGSESIAGIPLTVVEYANDGIAADTITSFHARFHDSKRMCDDVLGPAAVDGEYQSDFQSCSLHYAFYSRKYSTFALIQHHEGDGHVGNVASLDIRIIPLPANSIILPLETNMIF
jgi:hypothetical protein